MKIPALAPLVLALGAAACAFVPPRFADAPIVREVADDAPIPVPRKLEPIDALVLSDSYLRRPVLRALDPDRTPDAEDVNALDDVPRSSWIDPARPTTGDGPPVAPIAFEDKIAPLVAKRGFVVRDARGLRYELVPDDPKRAGLGTVSAIVASRLAGALGYRVAETTLVELDEARVHGRAAAVRWPVGIDLGPTSSSDRRGDDPNDRVPHENRRTLRALAVVAYWLGVSRVTPALLRDAYVGARDAGHVVHFVVGLAGALGADRVADGDSEEAAASNLLTLGLRTATRGEVQRWWPALGDYEPDAPLAKSELKPPFEPALRLLPADVHWIARRIEAVSDATIDGAIEAARVPDAASRARLRAVLLARRAAIVGWSRALTTPAEIATLDAHALELEAPDAAYRIEIASERGELERARVDRARDGRLVIPLEDVRGYAIVRARAEGSARAVEIHLIRDQNGARAVGVRR